MLNYDPKDAVQVWPGGDYDATLEKVEQKTSKKTGNDMEVWTSRVFHSDGREQLISDYVVVPGATFKIKQLAVALGREEDFKTGTFHAEDYIGASFKVALTIEQQDGFDDKNRIQKYKPASPSQATGGEPPSTFNRRMTGDAVATASARVRNQPRTTTVPFGDEQVFGPEDVPFAHRLPPRWI